jgi:hypothetical protein
MSQHPVNLAVRFLLELAALFALGRWGWYQSDKFVIRWALAIGVPLVAAVAWGTFAVPGDRSRSGEAPIPVPGAVRLALEMLIFGGAAWALLSTGSPRWALALSLIVIAHYVVSYDRALWLLREM